MGRSRLFLFIAWLITGILLLAGVGLTIWNLPLLRVRADMRSILRPHRVDITLGMLLDDRGATPAEREQIRNAFENPGQVDLYRISWNLRSRPTPFVGAAPDPGDQREGHINKQQLRDEREVAMPKPPNVYRIFLCGGSLAYSVGSDIPHSISRLLENELNKRAPIPGKKFEVWNAGVPSWASSHESAWIAHHLSELQPDLVIMLSGTNDCHWGYGGLNVMNLRDYPDDEYFALINQARRAAGVAPYDPRPPYEDAEPVPPAKVAERFAQNVRLAAAALEPQNVPVLVALQPSLSPTAKQLTPVEAEWSRKAENIKKIEYMEGCFTAMGQAARSLEADRPTSATHLHVASLRTVFAGRSDPIFVDTYHVGNKGNALIAVALADAAMPVIAGK